MKSDNFPIKAVVFDWAGTLIDFGSFAPISAFVEAFASFGVTVTIDEARAPMGLPKRAHIARMLEGKHVRQTWEGLHGTVDDAAIDRIYKVFLPMNERVAAEHATLAPGALDTLNWLKDRGIAIGTTTGYTRCIMNHVLPEVRKQGFAGSVANI